MPQPTTKLRNYLWIHGYMLSDEGIKEGRAMVAASEDFSNEINKHSIMITINFMFEPILYIPCCIYF